MPYERPHVTKEELDAAARSTRDTLQRLAIRWHISHEELAALLRFSNGLLEQFIDKPESLFTSTENELEPWRSMDQLIAIEQMLDLLLPDSSRTRAWIKNPNLAPLFCRSFSV